MHCDFCCGPLSGLVFVNELLGVFSFDNHTMSIPLTYQLLLNTLYIWDIHRDQGVFPLYSDFYFFN
jgi:hypothetical protein